MKQLFTKKMVVALFSFLALGALKTNAQTTVVIDEDFSTASGCCTPPTGWVNNTITGTGTDVWRFDNPGGRAINSPMAGKVAIFDSDNYSFGGGAEDVALESPTINTTDVTLLILEYDVTYVTGWNGELHVEVYNGSSWVTVESYTTTSVTNIHETIDITNQGADITNAKIRFRWEGDWSFYAYVDNVKVTQTIPYPDDIAIVGMESFKDACGRPDDTLAVKIKNVGTVALSNISVDIDVTGAGTASHSVNVPGPLGVNVDTIIKFPSSVFNTFTGGTYNVVCKADVANDADSTNDSLNTSFAIDGTPDTPVVMDVERCGNGSVELIATKGLARDQLTWYDAVQDPLAVGVDTFNTPSLFSNATYQYYVDASNVMLYQDFTGHTGGTGGDVPPTGWAQQTLSGTTGVDTWRFNNPGNRTPGGAISAPFAVFDSDNYSIGGGYEDVVLETPALDGTGISNVLLEFNHHFQAGFNSSCNVQVWDGSSWNTVFTTTGQVNSRLESINISAHAAGVNGFKVRFRYNGDWAWWWIVDNVKILAGAQECRSAKALVNVNVKGLPTGASASKGAPFQGTFNSGIMSSPDIVTAGDSISYEFNPPAGFTNANHGSTWQVVGFNFETVNGTAVPLADYTVVNPSATGNGTLVYKPSSTFIDSTLKVNLVIRDLDVNNGCDSVINRIIFVAPVPQANFSNIDVCFGDGMAFNNESQISSGSMTYEWNFGDGNTSSLTNPIYKYNTFGTFDVELIATSNYGYKDTHTFTVTVFETPNVSFKHLNACEGEAISFTNTTSVGAGSLAYTWDFGDGSSLSSNTNETHLYSVPGEYTVTLTAEANNCKSSIKKSVFQFPQPTADFSNSGGDCNETEIQFTSNASIAFGYKGHYWDFGDAIFSTEQNPVHTFETAGVNDVKLVVTSEFGCIDSVTKQITLKESPVASFTNSQVCDIDAVDFTNTSTIPAGVNVDYLWDFGDGNTSNLNNPSHNYALPLKRTVTLTATGDNGCISVATKEVEVGIQPQADFDFDPVCEDELTLFVNKTTISRSIPVTYEWFVDGNSISNDISLDYVFDNDGVIKVKLVATADDDNACMDEIEKDVQVDPTPDCNFTIESAGMGNRTTNFIVDNPETNVTYFWQYGDGGAGTGSNAQYKYEYDNVFIVVLTATAPNGCMCSDTNTFKATTVSTPSVSKIEVSVYPNPSKGVFTVKVGNTSSNDVKISVYNALGEVVYTMADNTEANAEGEYAINLNDMPAGVYTVKVESGSEVYTTKVNIVK